VYLIKGGLTLAGAVIVGFAIPAGWMRLGGEIQSLKESGTISMASVAVVFVGIIASYYLIIWLAGMAAVRRLQGGGAPRRFNWNRSMRDERHQAPTLNPLETLFVTTAILVGGAYMIWFFFFAEATLPGG
jgi:hypothetical protein